MKWSSLLSRVTRLGRDEVLAVIDKAAETYVNCPRFVHLAKPATRLTVCGDVHGQFDDMLSIFQRNGVPDVSNPYLFNGDFVDRGRNSKACVLTLLLYRILSPESMYLNRGNHELIEMNSYYGFKHELKDELLFQRFNELFELFPVAHVIGRKIFVVHGGIPRKIFKVDSDPLTDEIYSEMLWNDPSEASGITANPRGYGVHRFGPDITEKFLHVNGFETLIRSHEMVHDGFEYSQNGKCITVFSAPNYTGHYKNRGGYLTISKNLQIEPHQFGDIRKSRL